MAGEASRRTAFTSKWSRLWLLSGIEANPKYETLMRAVEIVRKENVDFLLAVGGGSVIDGTKFIAAATYFDGTDPYEICTQGAKVSKAVPFGTVLTLPATGSEMNNGAVISRLSTQEKFPRLFRVFRFWIRP